MGKSSFYNQTIMMLACVIVAACAVKTPALNEDKAIVFGELISIGSPLFSAQISLLPWDASIERLGLGDGQGAFVSFEEFKPILRNQSHSGLYTIVNRDGGFAFARVPLGDYLFVASVGWCVDETVRCERLGGFVTRRVSVTKDRNLSISVCGNSVHVVQIERPSYTNKSTTIEPNIFLPARDPLCRLRQGNGWAR